MQSEFRARIQDNRYYPDQHDGQTNVHVGLVDEFKEFYEEHGQKSVQGYEQNWKGAQIFEHAPYDLGNCAFYVVQVGVFGRGRGHIKVDHVHEHKHKAHDIGVMHIQQVEGPHFFEHNQKEEIDEEKRERDAAIDIINVGQYVDE